MYGQGGVQEGNADLVPELGTTWDAGGTFSRAGDRGRLYAELVRFESRTRDAIVWVQNSQRTARPENLERTRVRGFESVLRAAIHPGGRLPAMEWTATATFEDARDVGPSAPYQGKRLPYLPARQGSIETRIDGGRILIAHSIDLESSLYRDRYNTAEKRRDARALHDLEATWRALPGRLDATLAVRNLTDRQAQDVDGFPLPGRSIFAQLTWTVR
jgi:iron complex outermembrane receptor protein